MAKKFLKLNLEPTESQIEVAVDSYASEVGVLIDGSAATSEEIKIDIQNLTDAANAKTGNNDTNLADAVTSLVDGYGEEYEGVVTVVDGDPDLVAPINAYAAEVGALVGGGSSTPEGVKTDIQSLTAAANEKTEEADNTLAEAVETLIDHYGVAISGSLDITENGTFNVADKANVNVTVPVPDGYIMPSGIMTITENGTHDVTNYESVNVTVEGEKIPDYSESDFVLSYMNVNGGLSVGYNSTVKTVFEAAPDGAEIETFNDPNFYPENIKNGVSIFGVEGTYNGSNQGGGSMALVKITNTSTEYDATVSIGYANTVDGARIVGERNIPKNSTVNIAITVGAEANIAAVTSSYMGSMRNITTSGGIAPPVGGYTSYGFIVTGDGEIVGEAYDAD